MNKKLIIGMVAIIAALAAIIIAIIVLIDGFGAEKSESGSSDTDAISEISSSSGVTGNESVVSDYTVSRDGTAVIETENPDDNTIIEVPITVTDNIGFTAGYFVFSYDKTALTYINYAKGDLFDEYEVNNSNGEISCIINSAGFEDVKGDGKLIILKFKARDDAEAGSYDIKVENVSAGNAEERYVTPTVNGGTIKIKN